MRWVEAAEIVRILGIAGASVVLGAVSFAIKLLSMVLRAGGALLLVGPFGLAGAAWAYALALLAENSAHLIVAFRRLHLTAGDLAGKIWRGLLATAVMSCVLHIAGLGGDMAAPISSLAEGVFTGAGVYAIVLFGAWAVCGRPDGAETDLLTVLHGMRPA